MDLFQKYERVKHWYAQRDRDLLSRGERPTHRTDYGIWGAASTMDAFEFFSKVELERFSHFADYGSGDGRIVLVAALFTKAMGIEGDKALHEIAKEAKKELSKEIPELKRATFKNGNYEQENHKDYDMIWVFKDHPYPRAFEHALKKQFSGYLISYNRIHTPYALKKGKTYWVQQVPIVSYPINLDEEDLFAPTEKNKNDPAIK